MKTHEVIKMVWSKNTSKILFKIISAFSINFSISTIDMPEGMITIKHYLKVNLICICTSHVKSTICKIRLESFFESFVFYLTNTSLLCSWSVFNSTFSKLSTNFTRGWFFLQVWNLPLERFLSNDRVVL